MSIEYWDSVRPSYIENWPPALYSLSIPSIDVPLTVDDARRLGTNIIEYGEIFCPESDYRREDIGDIREKVSAAVAKLPAGAFIRLGSRSPKDSWEGHKQGLKVLPGEDPLRFILDASERMSDDLLLAIYYDYPPHIFVRQWMDIPPWSEFRCFMQDRKLAGISQYNYLHGEVFPEITEKGSAIHWVIQQFFPLFQEASHLDSVVFDVWVKRRTHGDRSVAWECKLLEINPFSEMTDPCLFSWKDGFDGSYRVNPRPAPPPDNPSIQT
jgi:hypothetical protein